MGTILGPSVLFTQFFQAPVFAYYGEVRRA